MSAFHVEVLEHKYVALRVRMVEELNRIDGRLAYYADIERDPQTLAMEKKYVDKKDKLMVELDRVDMRLQSYADLKASSVASSQSSAESFDSPDSIGAANAASSPQKMYRGRPVS